MAKKSSLLIPLLLLGILAIIALNWLIFFPWASMNHSATSDSIDRHEKLIADIAAELNDIRGVSARLQSGQLSPFDRRVREALKGGSQEVQDYLNSPLFSEEAGKRAPPPPAINGRQYAAHHAPSCAAITSVLHRQESYQCGFHNRNSETR